MTKAITKARRITRGLGLADNTGAVIWEGPSLIDGEPIAVVMTFGSTNRKTGDIHQTWIIPTTISPLDAIRTGADGSVCGGCGHRPVLVKAAKAAGLEPEAPCYVNVGQAPQGIYRKFAADGYPRITVEQAALIVSGSTVRFGAWGDPGAVPAYVWQALADSADDHTGYTHRWQDSGRDLVGLMMASVDTRAEMIEAWADGWATFRVEKSRDAMHDATKGEAICPSAKVSCEACPLKCNGDTGKVAGRRILDHGPGGEGRA
jgi:hypothetical protein